MNHIHAQIILTPPASHPHFTPVALGQDNHIYVLKCGASKKHHGELISKYLTNHIAQTIGLPATDAAAVEIALMPTLSTPGRNPTVPQAISPGIYYGSRLLADGLSCNLYSRIPRAHIHRIANLSSFAGVLALDLLCAAKSSRKALFTRKHGSDTYKVHFTGRSDLMSPGLANSWLPFYHYHGVYQYVVGWEGFEPYLTRLITLDPQLLWQALTDLPAEWKHDQLSSLETRIDELIARRCQLYRLLDSCRSALPSILPGWARPRLSSYAYGGHPDHLFQALADPMRLL